MGFLGVRWFVRVSEVTRGSRFIGSPLAHDPAIESGRRRVQLVSIPTVECNNAIAFHRRPETQGEQKRVCANKKSNKHDHHRRPGTNTIVEYRVT